MAGNKMSWEMRRQAFLDFHHKNEFGLVEHVIEDGEKHPFALIIPGGGYSVVCNYVEGKPFAQELNDRGISAFVLYYRVKKEARDSKPILDVAQALDYIFRHADELNLDTDNYSVWGSSAGGHLAAIFGTTQRGWPLFDLPKPGAIVLTYPVITMGPLTHPGSRDNFLGKYPSQEQINMASVEKLVNKDYPPTFIWCGADDHLVPPANSRMMHNALDACGVRNRLIEYPGVDHGVGLGKGLICEGWLDEAVRFWRQEQ